MIKREIIILTIIFAAMFLIFGTVPVSAESETQYGVYINNTKLDKNITVNSINGFDYIPLDQIKTGLNVTVSQDKSNNIITITSGKNTIKITQDSWVEANGKPKMQMDVPLVIKDNHIYFPVLALVDLLSFEIDVMDEIKCIRVKTLDNAVPAGKLVDAQLGSTMAAAASNLNSPKVAYLTFDDGIDSKITPMILDILKKEDIKATFFIIGNTVEKNKSILKRMIDEGHSIGNHTYTHKKENIYSSGAGLKAEIEKTNKAFYDAAGLITNMFRPPYGGTYIRREELQAVLNPYRVILWNVDSMDSRSRDITSAEIVNHVINQVKNKRNANIIMHDSGTHIETVKALPEIIKYLKENGFTILPIE